MRFTDEQWKAIQPLIPPPPSAVTRDRYPMHLEFHFATVPPNAYPCA
jgi:transposase